MQVADAIEATFAGTLDTVDQTRILKLRARTAAATGEAGERQAQLLEEIVRLDPLDGEALILLGQHHARNDQLEKACFLFERAAGMEEFEAQACLRHGQALVKHERYAKALPLLKRAQERKPREDLARYIEQVQRVARTQQ